MVDNYDFLNAVGAHPNTTTSDLLGAYNLLGVGTDQTPEELDRAIVNLMLAGFLEVVSISDDDEVWTYAYRIPGKSAA